MGLLENAVKLVRGLFGRDAPQPPPRLDATSEEALGAVFDVPDEFTFGDGGSRVAWPPALQT
jgi:hypothetical protein